ncbi:unnamed protein product [Coffea canephora]|uniref:Uncharacterized protein n=1 Tax=Coffea canephora TaxID=49390 RepID=A0A068V145_COFCA|nr:unnamed protein product [Coffea canephora]
MGSCGFLVNVKRSEVVAAALPVQEHWLPMSNLDLLLLALDVGVFFCYKKNNDTTSIPEKNLTTSPTENMVATIKKALAQALVSFYPFAGEVVQNRLGEPELLCNNRGVDFLDAFADIELKDLDLYHPDTSIHGKFVPFKNQGVLSIQVTELKCGGLVIGCTFDHRVADAHSANMFFTAWVEIAQAKGTATHTVPCLRRSLLNPRRPTTYDAEIDDLYVLLSSLPPPKELKASDDRLLSRIYYIEGKEIGQLQSMASSNGCRRTKLESFSAFLWKTIAEGSWVADMIHACIEGANKEDHFLGLIDWVEEHRPQPAAAAVYFKNSEDEEAIVISSRLRFPVAQMNFGWEMPDFGSYHFHWGGQTGYVMPMPSVSREGDWIVYMNLLKKHLDIVESKSGHVFRPLNPAYLKMNKGCWM